MYVEILYPDDNSIYMVAVYEKRLKKSPIYYGGTLYIFMNFFLVLLLYHIHVIMSSCDVKEFFSM